MARLISMAVIVAVLAAMLHYSAAQTVHVVGDNTGWTVPQGGAATYTSWASVFNFATNVHDVAELSKESFDACDFSSTIGSIITTGPANITLATAGNHYYVCTIGSHCTSGQKLAISVSATPGASPPSSSTATPPPTTQGGDSSSSTVFASVFVSLVSLVISFFL
ncbi:cucumber peeling cupredoxin isoform X2 [Vitis vinifera]|uniref:cucumber peeling cupredoxin isoform X2 n=1 Tax=Vitis vinifera TaxID=29760 RepID=UPI0005400922|nr:cucumber peeling cupredoxin isoform X2 [Vitis vinifera]|eukprot:XP_010654797.1 PREDICTED: cucumber peeling cupredoxin-like isoform X2 [Vitis vinifera]